MRPAAVQHVKSLCWCAGNQAAEPAGEAGGAWEAVQQSGGVLSAAGALPRSNQCLSGSAAGSFLAEGVSL